MLKIPWDYVIYPEDFPKEKQPTSFDKDKLISAEQYVPKQNSFGGFIYAGGTMSFTAGYWVLGALKPDVIAYIGCDMVYPKNSQSHFYGTGQAKDFNIAKDMTDLKILTFGERIKFATDILTSELKILENYFQKYEILVDIMKLKGGFTDMFDLKTLRTKSSL